MRPLCCEHAGLLVGICLLLTGCGLSAHHSPHLVAGPQTSPGVASSRLQVLCWNVHKQTHPRFLADLGQLVAATQPELVLLQEAAIDLDSNHYAAALGERSWALAANLTSAKPHREFGVATASRLAARHTALLSDATEPGGIPKPMLASHLDGPTGNILVINVHALNFSPRLNSFRRQLLQITQQLGTDLGPAVVAGDFNTWSHSRQALLDSVLGAAGLTRVPFGVQELGQKRAFGHPLDHIYYTPQFLELDTASCRVHRQITSSDHVPLEVQFKFR